MRRIVPMFLSVLAAFAIPRPAIAHECFGMLDYEIASGACAGTSRDATRILAQVGESTAAPGQDVVEGPPPPRPVHFGSPGRVFAESFVDVAMELTVDYSGPTIEPHVLATHLVPSDGKTRAGLESTFNQEVYLFDHLRGGNYTNKFFLPDTRTYFVEVAYAVFDGETLPPDGSRNILNQQFIGQMMRQPIDTFTPPYKEYYRERYIINGVNIELLATYFHEHHDAAGMRMLRAEARQALITDLGLDPASFSLKQIICSIRAGVGKSCDARLQPQDHPL